LLIILPFIAGIAVLFLKNPLHVKRFSLYAVLAVLLFTIYILILFLTSCHCIFIFDVPWISSIGLRFHIGLEGIGMLMVLLTNALMPLIILSGIKKEPKRIKIFYSLMLLMQSAFMGVFVSLDSILFYIFWELALIPAYFIVFLWGGEDRKNVTMKFFIYTLFGSLLMLVAFIYINIHAPGHSFQWVDIYFLNLSADAQSWLFWCFFLAFAIKMPIFPFHTWQPKTYTTAPTQGTMLLSGIMMKMGIFGAIRWMFPVVPLGVAQWGNIAMLLAVIGIIYASIITLKQNDLKTFIAWSSIAHVALIAAGLFAWNFYSWQGVMIQMVAHGINAVGLFFIIDIIEDRYKTRNISELGGIKQHSKLLAIFFMIILFGSIALPFTNGFFGELLMIVGIFKYNYFFAAISGTTIIVGAIYVLYVFRKTMLGECNELTKNAIVLTGNEKTILYIIAVLVILLGVYPQPVFNLTSSAVQDILLVIK
jgi:NADH-quinone oxidoreductase subunit M